MEIAFLHQFCSLTLPAGYPGLCEDDLANSTVPGKRHDALFSGPVV